MSVAAAKLRAIILEKEDGNLLGDEATVQGMVGVSRTTLRQVARLLEREGLLRVKRGSAGGYYASRPSVGTIETAVTAYLETLDVRAGELSTMASIIWVELLSQAAILASAASQATVRRLRRLITDVPAELTYYDLSKIEQTIRFEVGELVDTPYINFIFRVNIAFAQRRFDRKLALPKLTADDVEIWRQIKLLELEAIARGDEELGRLAGLRTQKFWRSAPHLTPGADT